MDIVTRYFDEPYQDQRAVDFLIPDKVTRDVGVFAVHGGGWAGGARGSYHRVLHAIASEGFACASTDYRLHMNEYALQHKLEDVRIGYDLFRQHLAERGLEKKVKRFATFGSSAGAHLAGLMAAAAPGAVGESVDDLQLKWKAPIGLVLVCGPLTFKPWPDPVPGIFRAMQALVGCQYEDDKAAWDAASIDTHMTADGPATFVIGAGNEHLFPNDVARRCVKRWRGLGASVEHTIYPGVEHGFLYETGPRKQQIAAMADMIAFFKNL